MAKRRELSSTVGISGSVWSAHGCIVAARSMSSSEINYSSSRILQLPSTAQVNLGQMANILLNWRRGQFFISSSMFLSRAFQITTKLENGICHYGWLVLNVTCMGMNEGCSLNKFQNIRLFRVLLPPNFEV